MKAAVTETPLSKKGMLVVTLYHKNETLTWNVSVYDRVTFVDVTTVFDSINHYWEQLPLEQQNSIWRVYKAIHEALANGRDVEQLSRKLRSLVKELYDCMPYEQLDYWVKYKANVRIPSTIPIEYNPRTSIRPGTQVQIQESIAEGDEDGPVTLPPSEMNYPRELTYLRSDYLELAVMAVALRPMIPIWGEYIGIVSGYVGSNFKEYDALELLYDTYFHEIPAWKRLETYMTYIVQTQQEVSHAMISDGLSTAMQPYWLMAGCLVRRVLFGNIYMDDEKASMIANISRYVGSTIKSIDTYFGGKITKKNSPLEVSEEDNSSMAEMTKIKTDIDGADLETLNFYAMYPGMRLDKIDPTLPHDLVNACCEFMQSLRYEEVYDHQHYLTAWVCHKLLAARGIPMLDKMEMLRMMGVAQATLWHWGFHDLAILISVIRRKESNVSTMWGTESRSRIPKELVDELEKLYPHYRLQKGKDRSVRHHNVGYRAIDQWCIMLERYEWRLNALPELAKHAQTIGTSKVVVIPTDIRSSLAKFFIRLNTPNN